MYSDIIDQVTGGGGGRGGWGGRNRTTTNINNATTDDTQTEIVVRFKAGRIQLQNIVPAAISDNPAISDTDDDATTTTTINNSNKENQFHCIARPERGEVRLVKTTTSSSSSSSSSQAQQYPTTYSWQWYNRTAESVQETIQLLPSTTSTSSVKDVKHTFERITLPDKRMYELDRVYVWTQIPSKKDPSLQQQPIYRMYWMQDADPSNDETIVTNVQKYFAEVVTAAITAEQVAASIAAAVAATTTSATASTSTTAAAAAGTGTTSTNQVDALSSILENLGMPQTSSGSSSMDISSSTSGVGAASTTRNQLTLADLQGAMASIQQQQQQQQQTTVGPPLQELVNTKAIDAIMNNPESCQRLIQFLPPEQQSIEYLRDNLTSSSMQSTLRTLTQMLVQTNDDDDDGINNSNDNDPSIYTEYNNIIANFQLDPTDGEMALLHNNNPIEAFLNCIIASVEREKQQTNTTGTAATTTTATPTDNYNEVIMEDAAVVEETSTTNNIDNDGNDDTDMAMNDDNDGDDNNNPNTTDPK